MPSLRKFRTFVRQYRHRLTAMDGGNADIAGAIYLPSSTSASFGKVSDPVQALDDNIPKYHNSSSSHADIAQACENARP